MIYSEKVLWGITSGEEKGHWKSLTIGISLD